MSTPIFSSSQSVAVLALLVAATSLTACAAGGEQGHDTAGTTSPAAPIDTTDRIAFARWGAHDDRSGEPAMWTANADGTDERPVGDQHGWYMEWSPDRSHLLFDFTDNNGSEQIATVKPDGSGFHQLTDGGGFSGDPAYSPDGALIAFTHSDVPESDPGFSVELWVMDANGGNPHPLISPALAGADFEPTFSPDGTRIAFTREVEGESGFVTAIHVANADGTGVQAMTPFDQTVEHARWSPDGSTIIYNIEALQAGLDDPRNGIWTVPATGGEPHQLLPTNDRLHVFKPDYSPDGSQVLFVCAHRNGLNEDLCTMDADGSNVQVIIETPEYENHAVWY